MWRYFELCTDLSTNAITALRKSANSNERNPRDIKADLANRIVADFYSEGDARKAEEDFNAVFRNKQAPEDIEERTLAPGSWKLPKLLVELGMLMVSDGRKRMSRLGSVLIIPCWSKWGSVTLYE